MKEVSENVLDANYKKFKELKNRKKRRKKNSQFWTENE